MAHYCTTECRHNGGGATYDTKVVRAETPARRPSSLEERLSRLTRDRLVQICRERRITGNENWDKADLVEHVAEDIRSSFEEELMREYEERYG